MNNRIANERLFITHPRPLFLSNHNRVYETIVEPIVEKTSVVANIYGQPKNSFPKFLHAEQNTRAENLCRLFGVLPTHAKYFYIGPGSREPASKSLTNITWEGNVKLFNSVCFDGSSTSFSINFEKLRKPFKERLTIKSHYDANNLSLKEFICGDPHLQVQRKHSIRTNDNKVTVSAFDITDALKIWIAFLDEEKEPNQHYQDLKWQPFSIQQLCRLLEPLVANFKQ